MGINIRPEDRILVVAPHPDDESIGCGGLISLYHNQVDVLLVTDGYNPELGNKEQSEIRQKEFQHAMELAQVHNYTMLHIPEHHIWENQDKFKKINFDAYSYVFLPNRYENHQDHVAVYKLGKKAISRKTKIYEYEVWTTIRTPNIIVDIESVLGKKREMIGCHESQIKDLDYVSLSVGLNSYRGQTHGLKYAEAFYCGKERFEKRIRHLKRVIKAIKK